MAQHEIRFGTSPNIKKIMGWLENAADGTGSPRACTTLAEFFLTQESVKGAEKKAYHYYSISAKSGSLIGHYWTGCLEHEGKGCEKNLNSAVDHLVKASELGNSQADHKLFEIFSQEEGVKDIPKAYSYLLEAMENGVTAFTDIKEFFKTNFDVLKTIFVERKGVVGIDSDDEIKNIHDAYVNEHLTKFDAAMKQDHLY